MMRRATLSALVLAWSSIAGAQAPGSPAARSEGQPPGPVVMYACPGGTDFSATFSKDGELATLSVPGQPEIELSRETSGSGFAYGDSYYQLRGRGREATLTAAGRAMRCHAVGRPGEPPRTFAGSGLTITLLPDGSFRLREQPAGGTPSLDLGQWSQEVAGGSRLVLRGTGPARVFREAGGDRLVAQSGPDLQRQPQVDPIAGPFRLSGMYRDTQSGGLFSECLTGRTFPVVPKAAEAELERAWTEATPSKEAPLFAQVVGRFVEGEIEVDNFIGLRREGACPPPVMRGAALRDTEWRVVEIEGERPAFESGRDRPRLRLDDDGRYTASTGCNAISGAYELDPDGLRFRPAAATLRACNPTADEIERRFVAALIEVREAHIAGTTLDLIDGNGKRRLRLDARGR